MYFFQIKKCNNLIICLGCWSKIKSFHDFYEQVRKIYNLKFKPHLPQETPPKTSQITNMNLVSKSIQLQEVTHIEKNKQTNQIVIFRKGGEVEEIVMPQNTTIASVYGIDNNSSTINCEEALESSNTESHNEIIELDSSDDEQNETNAAVSSILKRKHSVSDEDYRPSKCPSRTTECSERNSITCENDSDDSNDR